MRRLKLLQSRRGFTIIEVLVALAVSGMLLAVAVSTTFQTTMVTTRTSGQITATEDVKNVARGIIDDVWMAQTTNLVNEADPVDSLILDWTNWYGDTGEQTELDPVECHCEYAYLEEQKKVERKYWEGYQAEQPGEPNSTTLLGQNITSIGFSRSDYLVTVTIASAAALQTGQEEQKTYCISMHVMEEVPQ